jgi:hypothetical protein
MTRTSDSNTDAAGQKGVPASSTPPPGDPPTAGQSACGGVGHEGNKAVEEQNSDGKVEGKKRGAVVDKAVVSAATAVQLACGGVGHEGSNAVEKEISDGRYFAEWGANQPSECEPTKKSQNTLENAEGVTHQFSGSDTIEKTQEISESAEGGTHPFSKSDTTKKSRATTPVEDAPPPVPTLPSGVRTCFPTTSLSNEHLRVRLEPLPSGQSTRTPLLKRSTGFHSTSDTSPSSAAFSSCPSALLFDSASPLASTVVSSSSDHRGGPGGTIPSPLRDVARPDAGGYAEISGPAASHHERGTPTNIDEDRGYFIFDKVPHSSNGSVEPL